MSTALKELLDPSVIFIAIGALSGMGITLLDPSVAKKRKMLAVLAAVTAIAGGVFAWNDQQRTAETHRKELSGLQGQFSTSSGCSAMVTAFG